MKPKRVYVYFVEGKKGHRMVLLYESPWIFTVKELMDGNRCILSDDNTWHYEHLEHPIADFVPSVTRQAGLSE